MAQPTCFQNPFMLLMDPQVVLDAVAGSERLGQLRRHLCRPLDRPLIAAAGGAALADEDDDLIDDADE